MAKKGEAENESSSNNNSFGIVGVILGILSILFSVTIFIGSFAGLILGIIGIFFALKQRKINKNSWSTAGIILGIIGVIFNLAITALLISIILKTIEQIQALQASGLVN